MTSCGSSAVLTLTCLVVDTLKKKTCEIKIQRLQQPIKLVGYSCTFDFFYAKKKICFIFLIILPIISALRCHVFQNN